VSNKILISDTGISLKAHLSVSPLNKIPVVGVDHAPTYHTAFATEADTLSPALPMSVPVSGLIVRVPEQLGSASGPDTVSDHAVHTIVAANYGLFSTCLWPPIVHYCPLCKYPRYQNKISL
jgi:hypothetical protein